MSVNRAAEDATGCRTVVAGAQLYKQRTDGEGVPITDAEAQEIIRGEYVYNPNAGSGEYEDFAERMGYTHLVVVDWTSSAGDWAFAVSQDGQEWNLMFQENRHPYHGFKYSIDPTCGYFGTAQEVLAQIEEEG